MGLDLHDAEDIVQGFIADRILEHDLLGRADHHRGRFRSLLVSSLENYVFDQIRRKRIESSPVRTATGQDENSDSEWPWDQEQASVNPFDVAWARQVLEKTMAKMREECRQGGQADRWRLFEVRVIQPLWHGRPEPTCEELVQAFGFDSPRQASNALITAKRHFRRVLEETVAEYVCEGEDVTDELNQLASVVSEAGPLELDFSSMDCAESVASGAHLPSISQSNLSGDSALWGRLLGIDDVPTHPWSAAELSAIWQEQLMHPMESTAAPTSGTATVGNLLHDQSPSLELLRHLKGAARDRMREEAVPIEVAWALYFSAIAAAYVRHGVRISRLDSNLLGEGFQMLSRLPWLDGSTRGLGSLALSRLNGSEGSDTESGSDDALERDQKLAVLKDEQLRCIAEWKLRGHTHREVAQKIGCSLRSVERKWAQIQELWRTLPTNLVG
jgi:RNA polymerase sigma-70 factor (ECF subfamily)